MLDEEYDRTTQQPRLLRMHELGHALGFNHVDSLRSVMNPTVGMEPTDLDRRTARIAFRHITPDRPSPPILARN
jgi:predicted Zn-dependent protease